MTTINLPHGFILSDDRGRVEIEDRSAGRTTILRDPHGFRGAADYIDYVENAVNVKPGTFHSTIMGAINGQYRQAGAAVYGSASQMPSAGPGRPSGPLSPNEAVDATDDAIRSGAITVSQAGAYYKSLIGGGMNPCFAAPSFLGGGVTSAAMARQQLLQYQMMQNANWMGGPTGGPPHKPTDLKPETMRVGEIIAWRAWNIKNDELVSVVAESKPWSATEPMTGDPAGGYGIHAYKGPHGPLLDDYAKKDSSAQWVIGEVALWGDVIEHEEGYRAEFARVHSLVTWNGNVSKSMRDAIRAKYLTAAKFKLDDAA